VYWVTSAYCLLALSFTKLEGIFAAACLVAVLVLSLRLLRNLGVLGDPPAESATAPGSSQRGDEVA
jgi:hypothetical protein